MEKTNPSEETIRQSTEIKGSLLARNTLLNFIGQVVPSFVGMVTIPFIVRGLGPERFGLLSLAWAIMGYFAIFDLGLGRATTKFVAETLGKGEEDKVPYIVWTAVVIQAAFGVLGALVLAGITPLLVEHILNIPPELIGEAEATFYLLALSIPIVLVSGSFSGVLEAAQRFDLVNAIRIPSSTLTFLLPTIGLLLNFNLPGIVALILIARLGALSTLIVMNFYIAPKLRKLAVSFTLFPHLFSFGGWVMVSNMLAPFLRYLDRFMIGALLSMSAVAFYSVPFDILERLWIIPSSLVMTLFPAFSALSGLNQHERTQKLFLQASKYLIILVTPLMLSLIAFAKPIFEIWLGIEFARQSVLPFQILSIGVLIGLLAPIPGSIILGYGRPDIIGKLYLMYIPLNIGLVWLLVKTMGLPGAALSFTARTVLETALLFILASRIIRITLTVLIQYLYYILGSIIVGVSLLWLSTLLHNMLTLQVLIFLSIMVGFVLITWRWVLNSDDRIVMQRLLRRIL